VAVEGGGDAAQDAIDQYPARAGPAPADGLHAPEDLMARVDPDHLDEAIAVHLRRDLLEEPVEDLPVRADPGARGRLLADEDRGAGRGAVDLEAAGGVAGGGHRGDDAVDDRIRRAVDQRPRRARPAAGDRLDPVVQPPAPIDAEELDPPVDIGLRRDG